MGEIVKIVTVNISEAQTIIELSQLTQKFDSEIYLKKEVNGSIIEINLKSFLGLITLNLQNGNKLQIRTVGEDCEQAMDEVESYLSGLQ